MGDERAFTRGLARFFGSRRDVLVGIGDDAAVRRPPGRWLVGGACRRRLQPEGLRHEPA